MKIITCSLFLFFALHLSAQVNLDRCLSVDILDYAESKHPGYKQLVQQSFQYAKDHVDHSRDNDTYTIPVVVHIVYNTQVQNLHDSIIFEQIESLNEDYGRKNEDTIYMRSQFDPVAGNPNIEFKLAQIDPDGNPTTGITRTSTSTATFGSFALVLGDFDDLEAVKSTAEGGHDPWDTNRYLNIWVCNMEVLNTPAILGYASPPAGLPNWPAGQVPPIEDGVVIQYQAFGRNNPNTIDMGNGPIDVRGRTTTHEVGHYLGLRHIWADGDCNEQDGIDDTPNADDQSNFDCDQSKNTCTDNIPNVGDLDDMIENYMDYSAETCQNSFTQGQVDLMRGVLENQRYDLVHDNPASVESYSQIRASLFPNPADHLLSIQLNDPFNGDVQILDINGKKITQKMVKNSTLIDLDVSALRSGIYMVRLIGQSQSTHILRWSKL